MIYKLLSPGILEIWVQLSRQLRIPAASSGRSAAEGGPKPVLQRGKCGKCGIMNFCLQRILASSNPPFSKGKNMFRMSLYYLSSVIVRFYGPVSGETPR